MSDKLFDNRVQVMKEMQGIVEEIMNQKRMEIRPLTILIIRDFYSRDEVKRLSFLGIS